jgi:hypothetical protein
MPPKKAPKVKKPRLGRAGRAAPERKKSQKLKQIQKVNVQVTSGGGGGGSTAPAPFIPQQFRDTSGENVQLLNLVKSVSDSLARGNILGKVPTPEFAAPEVPPNPANDASTTSAVFNAPITYNDDLAEEVVREITKIESARNTPAKPPAVFNAPNTNNISLAERVIPRETGYASEYGGETDTGSARKRKPRKDKGVSRGSIKEKYRQVGFEEGVPTGRNIQNEFVMGVEQMQGRKINQGQMRLVPTEETMANAPAQSSSSADLNFA